MRLQKCYIDLPTLRQKKYCNVIVRCHIYACTYTKSYSNIVWISFDYTSCLNIGIWHIHTLTSISVWIGINIYCIDGYIWYISTEFMGNIPMCLLSCGTKWCSNNIAISIQQIFIPIRNEIDINIILLFIQVYMYMSHGIHEYKNI